jgi:putative sterol carrier protein
MTPTRLDGILASAVAAGAALRSSPGLTATVGLVLTGGADGDVKVWVHLVDGRPVEAAASAGPDPDVTLTVSAADAGSIAGGTLEPSVAFMRGRLKSAGDNGLVLRLLEASTAPDFGPWLAGITHGAPHRL